jgi:tetratricopeptide (TPR) repeat protein
MKYFVWLIFISNFAWAGDQIAARLKLAQQDYAANRNDKVIALLNPYSEELPSPGLMMLASAYSAIGKYDEEERILRTLVSKNENNYQAYMLLAQSYQKEAAAAKLDADIKKFRVKAIQTFRQCLKLRKTFKPAYDGLLETLIAMKDNNESREVVVEGLTQFGHRPELINQMCRLDATGGFVDQAVTSCREAVTSAPNYPDSYVYLAQALSDQKENIGAEKEIVKAANRFPASEFVQWAAGTVFMKKQNYPVSARYFSQALRADPKSSRAEFGYAQALFESGQTKQALPVYVKACKMEPSLVLEPFLTAASKLRQKGDAELGQRYKELATTCQN